MEAEEEMVSETSSWAGQLHLERASHISSVLNELGDKAQLMVWRMVI